MLALPLWVGTSSFSEKSRIRQWLQQSNAWEQVLKAIEPDIHYDKISSVNFEGEQADFNNDRVVTLCERQSCFMETFKFWARRRGVSISDA